MSLSEPQPTGPIDTRLAALMNSDVHDSALWGAADIAAVFEHQLATPILHEAATADVETRATIQSQRDAAATVTMGELFLQPNPSLDLLSVVKNLGKTALEQRDAALPREVAAAMYWLAIAAALVRQGQRLSSADDHALHEGFTWLTARAWIDEANQRLARDALAMLTV